MADMALSTAFTFKGKIPESFADTGKLFHPADPSTVVKSLEGRVPLLRSAFNAIAPANHLPAELVIEVLISGAWSWWKELVALTHICQHWRNVALGTPQLWADVVESALGKYDATNAVVSIPCLQALQEFLSRSGSYPLRLGLGLGYYSTLDSQIEKNAVLEAYLWRLTHLSLHLMYGPANIIATFETIRSRMQSLKSLDLTSPTSIDSNSFTSIELPTWDDSDLPHLHTLSISGRLFGPSIAVKSLKTLILYHGPRSHDVFLAALDRCALALESLTLCRWSHPERRASNARNSTTPTVQFPSLRRLKVALEWGSHTLALLLAGLSFPSDVAIDLDWHRDPGNTRQLLPKHLIGLHAPPFFDSMCLHLSGPPGTVRLHCYLNGTEHLRVQEVPMLDSIDDECQDFSLFKFLADKHPDLSGFPVDRRRDLSGFLDEHRYPTVTQLAVDIDIDTRDPDNNVMRLARGDLLREYIGGFPNLRRLDLLGKTIGDVKLEMAKAFLELPRGSPDTPVAAKTLAYVCEASEDLQLSNPIAILNHLREQLDQLQALLRIHHAGGGPRLHRLEICIAYSSRSPHPPPRVYPYIRNVPPRTVLTAYLSSLYLPSFEALVSEVVFIGDVKKPRNSYRVLTGGARRLPGPMRSSPGEKGRKG